MGHIAGVDAVKTHPAQNEWRNRSRRVHTTGKAAGGYRSAIAGHRQKVRKRVGTHGIDRASPALLCKRLGRSCELLAVDDLGCTRYIFRYSASCVRPVTA